MNSLTTFQKGQICQWLINSGTISCDKYDETVFLAKTLADSKFAGRYANKVQLYDGKIPDGDAFYLGRCHQFMTDFVKEYSGDVMVCLKKRAEYAWSDMIATRKTLVHDYCSEGCGEYTPGDDRCSCNNVKLWYDFNSVSLNKDDTYVWIEKF